MKRLKEFYLSWQLDMQFSRSLKDIVLRTEQFITNFLMMFLMKNLRILLLHS